ncbi:uncharacterized protein MONOS_14930 [Monocercomonoides exilis]|uniref:uncharacterized protein n=1 Tax=Monocercomonoides exilis TaxID=2049356 RepID=UPI00355951A7|nr:hypothetical protein MONOS_14930 [Monocercomonoides exilis]|eukprot:MONOS_14930.1-p1 / transcript=MONOS_14930.1 / gene=MONOS_14930 / organism=Monocercomonoides_exilis_PA203 / gene_product=unspecified product / transcript_product=unspecified product / location=Mono_scaffold01108:495-3191(+) / protein_length=899 / sequence_SO=supercontig / SO=protein_coding / is_pseudo=false
MPEFSETGLPPSASVSSSWRPSASASASSTSTSTIVSESSSSPSSSSSSPSSSTKVDNQWFSPPKKSLWKRISEEEEKNFEGVEERKEMEIVDKDKKKERKGRGGMNEKNRKKGKREVKGRISGLLKKKKEEKLREVVLVDESEFEEEDEKESENQRFSLETLSSDSSDTYDSSDSSVELAFKIPTFTQLNGNSMESQNREDDFLGLDNHPPLLRSISSMSSSSSSPSSSQTVTADMSDWEKQQSMKEKQSESSPRRCRAINMLMSMTEEELRQFDKAGPGYADSTLEKHAYVEQVYATFCEQRRISMYPLNKTNASAFLRFLYRSRCYVRSTIENVFACSLKRIEIMRTGSPISDEVEHAIAQVLREGRNDKNAKGDGKGKEPCILSDVERIIDRTNDQSPTKAMEASLWLVAINTGARAITVSNVLIGDIGALITSESGETQILKIKFRITKANQNWNHTVSIEGTLDQRDNLNCLYWLNQHLKNAFDLDLHNRDSWVLGDMLKKQRLWNLTRDAMSQRLRRRAQAAGYPHDLFSFHSFRSGFMCSAILAAGVDAHARDSAYMYTAAIAGWIPNSKVQNRYAKPAITASIVASRVIKTKIDNEVIDMSLVNPETFHNINFNNDIEHNICERTAIQWVRRAFKERINVEKVTSTTEKKTEEKRKLYRQRAWKDALARYVASDDAMEKEASEIYTKHKNYKENRSRTATMNNARVDVGIRHLNERYYDLNESVEDIVDDLLRFVDDEIEGKKEMKVYERKKPCPYEHSLHREVDEKGHRKRVPWTEEEDLKLLEMNFEKKRMVEMAAELPGRMPRDCRDRLRNLGVIEGWKDENMTKKKMKRRKMILKDDNDSDENDEDDDSDDEETEEIEEKISLKKEMKKRNTKERKIEIHHDDEK